MSTRDDCPNGPHRGPEGPNEDISQCLVCWSVSYEMRPDGETYGDHLPDCSLPLRHESYCQPGGAGHPTAPSIRGYWPEREERPVSADRPVSPAPDTVTDDMYAAAGLAMVPYGDDDEVNLFEWHHCADRPTCTGATGPCPCSGIPWPSKAVRAAIEAVVPLIRERLAAVDPADLRLVLDQDTAHYHQRPGVWDDDNPPERAGRPCDVCAARGRLRVALDGDAPECREARAEIDAETPVQGSVRGPGATNGPRW